MFFSSRLSRQCDARTDAIRDLVDDSTDRVASMSKTVWRTVAAHPGQALAASAAALAVFGLVAAVLSARHAGAMHS